MITKLSLGNYDYEDQSIPIIAALNNRAKRISLRYDHKNQNVVVTVPTKSLLPQARLFVKENHAWIVKCANSQSFQFIKPNSVLTIFGKPYFIKHVPSHMKQTWLTETELIIYSPDSHFTPLLEIWIKSLALTFFEEKSYDFSKCFKDLIITKISIQDRKTAWGTCSGKGNLSYSWRLALAPLEVALYVCAHEVCHLMELNHSPKFWKIVSEICPSYKEHRSWLKQNGKSLFSYKF